MEKIYLRRGEASKIKSAPRYSLAPAVRDALVAKRAPPASCHFPLRADPTSRLHRGLCSPRAVSRIDDPLHHLPSAELTSTNDNGG